MLSKEVDNKSMMKVSKIKNILVGLFTVCGVFAMVLVSSAQENEQQIVWERGADIPLARGGYFAEWLEGRLWLGGGSYWKDGKKLWTTEVSLYDPQTDTWSNGEPLPKAFGYGVTARIGKAIYILGGADEDGTPNKHIYKFSAGKWDVVGMTPDVFVYPAYTAVGSSIYIFGGSSSSADVTQATADLWIYHTDANVWKKASAIPGKPRQIFSAAAIGELIYVFGGVTQKTGEDILNLDDAYRFDTTKSEWKKLKPMPVAMRAFWAGSDRKEVFLIGGYSDAGLDTVYKYIPERDDYEKVSKLPQPLMDTKFIYGNGKFYGASGEDKPMSRFGGLVIGSIK